MSIIIPAYNEEKTLPVTVPAIVSTFRNTGINFEIVIVNDGSSDETEKTIQELKTKFGEIIGIFNSGLNGYGYAVRKGLEAYKGDAVIIVMADGSEDPKDIITYVEAIVEGNECAFGSRFMKGAVTKNYLGLKWFLNRFGNYLISLLTWTKYNDFTNGFKCYRREIVDQIQPLLSGQFNLTIEMSIKAIATGCRYKVLPTKWQNRNEGCSKFGLYSQVKLYLTTLVWLMVNFWLSATVSCPSRPKK